MHHEALRNWIRQDEADRGQRDDRPTISELEELRRLRRENTALKRANEILKAASAFSPRNSTRPGDGRDARQRATRPLRGRARPPGPQRRRLHLLRLARPGSQPLPSTARGRGPCGGGR
ncbi:transposase [Micromonospora sp. SD12]|uniref:transposase n=1 Tax=Micromonospora sp. SD12 TaxID=3452216 RepID=UPI003F8CD420